MPDAVPSEKLKTRDNLPAKLSFIVSLLAVIHMICYFITSIVGPAKYAEPLGATVFISFLLAGGGFVSGILARVQIHNNPDEFTGKSLANAGIILCLIYLILLMNIPHF